MRVEVLIKGRVLNAKGFFFRIQDTTGTDSFIVRARVSPKTTALLKNPSRASLAFRAFCVRMKNRPHTKGAV